MLYVLAVYVIKRKNKHKTLPYIAGNTFWKKDKKK